MFISANHQYVLTLHLYRFNCVFRHKPHVVRFRKRLCFGFKSLFWSTQTQLEMFVAANIAGNVPDLLFCPQKHNWELSKCYISCFYKHPVVKMA